MKPHMKTIFALEPSQEQKATLCRKVSNSRFEMAEKKMYKQTDIFVFIIVEMEQD